MEAVILAAGEGTRMRPLTASCPKVMLPVANRPILEHIIGAARDVGIDEFVCVVGYMGDVIRGHFEDGSRFGVRIDYVEQKEQLGTAHAIGMASRSVGARFLVLNGDAIVTPPDLRALVERKEDIVLATKELRILRGTAS